MNPEYWIVQNFANWLRRLLCDCTVLRLLSDGYDMNACVSHFRKVFHDLLSIYSLSSMLQVKDNSLFMFFPVLCYFIYTFWFMYCSLRLSVSAIQTYRICGRAFAYAGPSTWNSLLPSSGQFTLLSSSQRHLKTFISHPISTQRIGGSYTCTLPRSINWLMTRLFSSTSAISHVSTTVIFYCIGLQEHILRSCHSVAFLLAIG